MIPRAVRRSRMLEPTAKAVIPAKAGIPFSRLLAGHGDRANALVEPEKFLRISRARAVPAQLPAFADRRWLDARRLHQEKRAIRRAAGADSGEVMEHRALRLGEVARGDALALRSHALHVGDYAAVALCVVKPRQPERHRQAPDQRYTREPAPGQRQGPGG